MKSTRRRFLSIAGGATLGALAAPALLQRNASRASAQAIPGAPVLRGAAGKSIQGPVSLNAGMVVLRAQHNGASNFGVTLFLPSAGETAQQNYDDGSFSDYSSPYNEIGAYRGGAVSVLGTPGDHYLAVDASGAYQISLEQPLPSNVTGSRQATFSGRGNDVTPYFTLPAGITSLSVDTSSTSLRAWLYHLDDLGGAPLPDGINVYDGRFFDFSFPDNQSSYPVRLPDSGPYLLAVNNLLTVTDAWTLTFR